MKCSWPDGRAVAVIPDEIVGDRIIVAAANEWLIVESVRRSGLVAVTPTGPFVLPDDELAMFAAVNAVAPGGEWVDAPDLTFGAPEDAIF
jgi:hypothetical protein